MKLIQELTSLMAVQANFEIRIADIPSVAAAVIDQNRRYVVYNPSALRTLTDSTGSSWAAIAIIAHEIGHHFNGDTLLTTPSHKQELDADYFSGFILAKMGASRDSAIEAVSLVAPQEGTDTHPPRAERQDAVIDGWKFAQSQGDAGIFTERPTPPSNEARPEVPGTQVPKHMPVQPQPQVTLSFRDRCMLRGIDVLIDSQGKAFTVDTRMMSGHVVPPLAPFCAFDIVSLLSGSRYCVTKVDGTILTGNPLIPVGSCRKCVHVSCPTAWD